MEILAVAFKASFVMLKFFPNNTSLNEEKREQRQEGRFTAGRPTTLEEGAVSRFTKTAGALLLE